MEVGPDTGRKEWEELHLVRRSENAGRKMDQESSPKGPRKKPCWTLMSTARALGVNAKKVLVSS